jgi:hypothetical protein
MLTCPNPTSDTLAVYYADTLQGPWKPHPQNPVVSGNADIARGGGRVSVVAGRVIRFAQDCQPTYGTQVRAFEIVDLTTEHYAEKALAGGQPILKGSGAGWNASIMHHVDAHPLGPGRWIACVDGGRKSLVVFGRRVD